MIKMDNNMKEFHAKNINHIQQMELEHNKKSKEMINNHKLAMKNADIKNKKIDKDFELEKEKLAYMRKKDQKNKELKEEEERNRHLEEENKIKLQLNQSDLQHKQNMATINKDAELNRIKFEKKNELIKQKEEENKLLYKKKKELLDLKDKIASKKSEINLAEIEAKYKEESLRQKNNYDYNLEKVKSENEIALQNLNIEKEKEIMEYNNKAAIIDKTELNQNQVYELFSKLIPQYQEHQINNNTNSNHGPCLNRSSSFCVPNTQINYNINNQYNNSQRYTPMNTYMNNGINYNNNIYMNTTVNYYTPRFTNYNNQMYMNNYNQANCWQNNMQNPHGLRRCYSQVFQ